MEAIGQLWAGQIYGTNTGKLFAELTNGPQGISGIIRLNDDRYGIAVLQVEGTFSGGALFLKGRSERAPSDLEFGDLTIEGSLNPEGRLTGRWASSLGTAGTFILFPHDQADTAPRPQGGTPEQIHTTTRSLGALRIYADDLREIIQFIGRDFRQSRPVVTYNHRGHQVSRYTSDFELEWPAIEKLLYIKIYVQEPDDYNSVRFAQIELNAAGANEIRVQGVQESWVIGKAESLNAHLKRHQSALSTTARWAGLNVGGLIAIFSLVMLPELPLLRRAAFVVAVGVTLWLFNHLHRTFVGNAVIYLSNRTPSWAERLWPQTLSWLIAATSAVVASIAYGWLKGELTAPGWMLKLIAVG